MLSKKVHIMWYAHWCHVTSLYSLDPAYENTEKQFYNQPMNWLSTRFRGNHSLPTHLIMFDVLLPLVEEFVRNYSYTEVSSITWWSRDCHMNLMQVVTLFHTHILDNSHVGHHIVLYHKWLFFWEIELM